MSKGGGAGKVYFVLYLAVVLELLIIIVERDEAEEGLLRKQRESMKIVESILSQLQSGAGTEGINTRPQDEITVPEPGVPLEQLGLQGLKDYRTYLVEVGVTDVSEGITRREEDDKEYNQKIKDMLQLANVRDIQYQLFFYPIPGTTDKDPSAPGFPSDEELKKNFKNIESISIGTKIPSTTLSGEWEFLGLRKLMLDTVETYKNTVKNAETRKTDKLRVAANDILPFYTDAALNNSLDIKYAPKDSTIFKYSDEKSKEDVGKIAGATLKKRTFVVNFRPERKQGWYKLRFFSQSNRILGVRGGEKVDQVSDETTVNIGTVKLTVRDLRKVQKELTSKLEKYTLPQPEDFDKVGIEGVEKMLNEATAKVRASKDDDARETIGKIELYGYILQLLSPGQSTNFKQNKGSIEFNVHVLTPTPPPSDPTIDVLYEKEICRLDATNISFKVKIGNYKAGSSRLTGTLTDKTGKQYEVKLSPDPAVQNDPNAPTQYFIGQVDYIKVETIREYTLKLEHTLNGKVGPLSERDVFLCPSLDKSNIENLSDAIDLYYGQSYGFKFTPPSGTKIGADKFKITITPYQSGSNNQSTPITYQGYNLDETAVSKIPCSWSDADIEITWEDPVSQKSFPVYPRKKFEVKQEAVKVNAISKNAPATGSEDRLVCKFSGSIAELKDVPTGSDKLPIVNISAVVSGSSVKGYSASTPQVDYKGGRDYTVTFFLTGTMGDEDAIRGTVDIKVTCETTNPCQEGKKEKLTKTIKYNVSYTPGQD
ncbi:MAG: hypothetical protein NT007_16755 [Candidatus Kapabacteria bacterium]|nr:hypothetical protein [Candidatus Kapabacteria bacterium]